MEYVVNKDIITLTKFAHYIETDKNVMTLLGGFNDPWAHCRPQAMDSPLMNCKNHGGHRQHAAAQVYGVQSPWHTTSNFKI